jgi:hypothetical protein
VHAETDLRAVGVRGINLRRSDLVARSYESAQSLDISNPQAERVKPGICGDPGM